jgi:cell division septal protein FtsQ
MIADFMMRYGSKWLAAGFSIACLALFVWMLTSPTFRIDRVVIVNDANSSKALLDKTDILSRLAWVNGENVFRLDTTRVAEQIEAEPSVQWADVEAGIDGQLRVLVTYRRPVANWNVAGTSYLVGKGAILLAEGSDGSLPFTVEQIGGNPATVGQQVNPDALEMAHKLNRNLPVMGVEPVLIAYSAGGGLVIRDTFEREIIFGPPEDLTAKLIALKAVLDDAARQGEQVRRIDLRPLERPTYQIRED